MNKPARYLETEKGRIDFPAYIPVTTYGGKYPLDDLIRPYLPRLAPAIMVSHHYALQMKRSPRIPLMVDSGGFAALFDNSFVKERKGLGILEIENEDEIETIDPKSVLEFQEEIADIAFTLDFPIPPGLDQEEAQLRQKLTIANALWALRNRRNKRMRLYACIQAWDETSARTCTEAYRDRGFDGIGIGGLVPRLRNLKEVETIVKTVRQEIPDLPLHAFGVGKPEITQKLIRWGVDSVDSSSYVQAAADGKSWIKGATKIKNPSTTDRLHLALTNLAYATEQRLPLSTHSIIHL